MSNLFSLAHPNMQRSGLCYLQYCRGYRQFVLSVPLIDGAHPTLRRSREGLKRAYHPCALLVHVILARRKSIAVPILARVHTALPSAVGCGEGRRERATLAGFRLRETQTYAYKSHRQAVRSTFCVECTLVQISASSHHYRSGAE